MVDRREPEEPDEAGIERDVGAHSTSARPGSEAIQRILVPIPEYVACLTTGWSATSPGRRRHRGAAETPFRIARCSPASPRTTRCVTLPCASVTNS